MENQDFDELLNAVFGFAQQLLEEYDEFFPFGANVNFQDEIDFVSGYDGDEQPLSQDLMDIMISGMKEKAIRKEIRSAVVCFDVCTALPEQDQKIDAICAHLEHIGNAIDIYLPYWKNDDIYRYGELFARIGVIKIF